MKTKSFLQKFLNHQSILSMVKRATDISISLLVIVFVLSWLFPLLFIISKFLSEGPILFVQKRVGINNTVFNCFKFRTINREQESGEKFDPIYIDDSRLTRLGKILRNYNLDELPQFINVLTGKMSIVGPRPHAIFYDKTYSRLIEENNLRHIVKPGITGWAQIHGLRGDVLDESKNKVRIARRIRYDLWYIQNRSIALDIKIIFWTIRLTLQGRINSVQDFHLSQGVKVFVLPKYKDHQDLIHIKSAQ